MCALMVRTNMVAVWFRMGSSGGMGGRGVSVSAHGGPKHGCGSVWDPSESPGTVRPAQTQPDGGF